MNRKQRKLTDFTFYDAVKNKKLKDFRVDSIDLDDEENTNEDLWKTIQNFLELKITNRGANIPSNMKKMIMIAKGLVQLPKFLYLDEDALDLGGWSSFGKLFRKIDHVLEDSIIFAVLHSIDNISNFDHVIFMDKGRIVESGRVNDLIKDKGTRLGKLIARRKSIALSSMGNSHYYDVINERSNEQISSRMFTLQEGDNNSDNSRYRDDGGSFGPPLISKQLKIEEEEENGEKGMENMT